MRDPLRVRVSGPLEPFVAGFVAELGDRGYARSSVVGQVQLVARLSRWMAAGRVAPGELTAEAVERFVRARREAGYRHFLTSDALAPLLAYLWSLGVASVPAGASSASPVDLLVDRYRGYLVGERGLAAGTVRYYERVARMFLEVSALRGEAELAGLTTAVIGRFVLAECGRCSAGSSGNVVVALRSLLRYLHVDGLVAGDLAAAVPSVAPRPRGLPRALPPGAVGRLLSSCDRRRPKGRRDYAVLMVLSRLGLRAAEVSAIRLGDVDWRDGELVVRGKPDRRERMPLPVDVGEALAGYIQRGRPRVDAPRLFWRVTAPIGPLSPDAVSEIVRHACRRCGLPLVGAHALRHTVATETLRAGGSLAERPAAAPADCVHDRDLRARRPHGARGARAPVAGDRAMSALREACAAYLALRRATGFKLHRHGRMLPDLVAHLEAAGLATITTRAALEWAMLPAGHPQEWPSRLSVARGFARYLRTLDETGEIPPSDLLPSRRRRPAPHLYSDEQIAALMAATETIHFPQRGATYRALIGLLAITGMRIGEAIALDRDDIDLTAGCVTVRAGKFNAARELPLHDTTVRALDEYRTLRDRCWPAPTAHAFFLSMRGTRLHPGHVRETFRDLRRHAGISAAPGARQPRVHDLRHSFAVATLVDWHRADVDIAARLPRLSSYLGHSAPEATYYYLQATPELLALAAERLERLEARS